MCRKNITENLGMSNLSGKGKVRLERIDVNWYCWVKLESISRKNSISATTTTSHGPKQIRVVAFVDSTLFAVSGDDVKLNGLINHKTVRRTENPMASALTKSSSETNRF